MTADTIRQPGMLLIISGPSGVGKTTITRAVAQRLQARISVSVTTRPQAATDVDGKDYWFIDRSKFETMRAQGRLLEWAEVYEGCFYGTPVQPVEEAIARGELMILEIDVQGAIQVRKLRPDAWAMFILPPSEDVLLERLRKRGREDEKVIQRRFAKARQEIALAQSSGVYDHFLVNDVLDTAIAQAVAAISRERSRRVQAC